MRAPSERGFKTAYENRDVPVGFSDAVAIYDGSSVGSQSCLKAGGVIVLAAAFFCGGIVSDHGVDISGGNEEAEAWFTEPFELVGGAELGLAEHCAGKAVFSRTRVMRAAPKDG